MADFVVRKWAVWAPGMDGEAGRSPIPLAENAPLSAKVPKMLQRRLTPLARAVFYVAEACLDDDEALPIVFSTAHGEINQSLAMLKSMQQVGAVSPTAFSLSVHNALSGLFSMAHANHQEISVIAPGQDGIAPAFIEALGLLHESHDEVLMVFYDEPLPGFYPIYPFMFNTQATLTLALRISLAGSGLLLGFDRSPEPRDEAEHALQISLFWKFILGGDQSLMLGNHRHGFEWRKK